MFQLIYLTFTAPRQDSTAFLSFQSKMKAYYENKGASPNDVFDDSLTSVITQNHPRYRPLTAEKLDKMDMLKSHKIYRDRFADAGDFTFIFVGNFTLEQIKPLAEMYLGGLPSTGRVETWKDQTYDYPKGIIQKAVHKGIEQQSSCSFKFTGPFEWNAENKAVINGLTSVLRIKLREKIREDKGGTYGVGVSVSTGRFPRQRYSLNIGFDCSPDRVEELSKEVFSQIDSLRNFPVAAEYLEKVKNISSRKFEKDVKLNRFWLSHLKSSYYHSLDPLDFSLKTNLTQKLTIEDIQKAAQKYINTENYVRLVLYPEKKE